MDQPLAWAEIRTGGSGRTWIRGRNQSQDPGSYVEEGGSGGPSSTANTTVLAARRSSTIALWYADAEGA
jgi:hypothetical protein